MEAMKMQTPILSEITGIVTAISAKNGDSLKPGDRILKVDIDE
jgi:pyruvate carboxylase